MKWFMCLALSLVALACNPVVGQAPAPVPAAAAAQGSAKMLIPEKCIMISPQPYSDLQPILFEAVLRCLGGIPAEIDVSKVIWPKGSGPADPPQPPKPVGATPAPAPTPDAPTQGK